MKLTWISSLLFIALTTCSAQYQNAVDYGYLTSQWVYKNEGLGIEFPLPDKWYFNDASSKKLVKIGSDVKKLRAYTSAFKVPISEFKESYSNRIATLIEFTKLDSSSMVIAEEIDDNADKTISLGVVYSNNSDPYSFLRATCGRCDDTTFKQIFLKDVVLGNAKFDGYITGVRDRLGRKTGHFFGAKRIGKLYIICQFNFAEPKDFESYKKYFDKLKFN